MFELPTVEVDTKVNKNTIIFLVVGLCIVVAFSFMLFNLSKIDT